MGCTNSVKQRNLMEISLVPFTSRVRIFAKRIISMWLRMIVLPLMQVRFHPHRFQRYLVLSMCV